VRVLGEEPGPGLPNQHTKACPRFQTMHCWCPPATGPGQPHLSSCSHFKRPAVPTHAFIGSYHDWDLTEAEEEPEPEFGKMTAKIADAAAAEPGEGYPGPGAAIILKPGEAGPFDYQAYEAYTQLAYKHALQWLETQKPQSYVHAIVPSIVSNELCTCTCTCAASGVGHALACPLSGVVPAAPAGEKEGVT
jgi:hypothetical protein